MYGEYEHTVDAKGRMFLPAKFRTELGDRVFVTLGFGNCLNIYPTEEWEKFVAKLDTLPPLQVEDMKRVLCADACETDVDAQGRVLLPSGHRSKVKLGKTVVVIGVGNKAEVWDAETYRAYREGVSYDSIKEKLMALGL